MEACPCDTHERQRDEEDDRHKDSPYQFRHVNSHLVIARLSGDRSYHPTTALQEFSTWVPPYGGVCTHNLPNLDPMHSFRSPSQNTGLVRFDIRIAQRYQAHHTLQGELQSPSPLPPDCSTGAWQILSRGLSQRSSRGPVRSYRQPSPSHHPRSFFTISGAWSSATR